MENKYCDCGDPFQIHDPKDPRCSIVRGISRKVAASPLPDKTPSNSNLLAMTRRVSRLANTLSDVTTILGVLTVIGGIFIGFQSSSIDLGDGYSVSSHPYITLGIVLAVTGILQILVLRLVFNYIEMQARYRQWQLIK